MEEDTFSYTCGTRLDEVELIAGHTFAIQAHNCGDTVEALYYSNTENDVICVYCSELLPDLAWNVKTATTYPKCDKCSSKADIRIKGKRPKPTDE